ncbi:MAG: DinB family protein [Cytophagales bacterium]|nr:MAG: DinB family protein [Cytophagales bacterium]
MSPQTNLLMTINDLQTLLRERAQSFLTFAQPLTDDQFVAPLNGDKWSVAENLQHLYLSARPVARVLAGPREFLAQFGTPAQPSRSYEDVVAVYRQTITANGIKAPATMSARPEDLTDRAALESRFLQAHTGVADALANWTEAELDGYVIPHPALGPLTVREMIYFTAYHVEHHLEPVRKSPV